MSQRTNTWTAVWFAIATLISAFLVFQVQPVMSKTVLPWFGGSPAVWTTCMLFFQIVLFAGYAYAHAMTRFLSLRQQGRLHFLLIAAALLLLPITPDSAWKPAGAGSPSWKLLMILAANVGLPYFLLSSTGPLLQAWFSQRLPGRSPYRLYALSNVGSLAALVSYPFLVEPALTTTWQGSLWSIGFCLFAVVCGSLAIRNWNITDSGATNTPADETVTKSSWKLYLSWLLLPACASVALLATTNHVCQDIAVIPFLWVAPLSLYLLTFIICFDREQWYSKRWCGLLAALSALGICVMVDQLWNNLALVEIAFFLNFMFWVCMVCHGELVRLKPASKYLTAFYLMTSGGGALGGITVALLCPWMFSVHWELSLIVITGAGIGLYVFLADAHRTWLGSHWKRRVISGLVIVAVMGFIIPIQIAHSLPKSLATVRNFYGVLHVRKEDDGRGKIMVHGRTVHGFQFRHPAMQTIPTSYYSPDSGIGIALTELWPDRPLRVGAVGLGCGTIAAYGREGDYYRFYEINPAVEALAREHFTFLERSPATTEVILGDARLSLEQEEPQDFDLLVLDAFSSDSIPTHLLTREAFAVYRTHLKPNGVLAIHISNRNLRLSPVVVRLATQFNLESLQITNQPNWLRGSLQSKWMLLTQDRNVVHHPAIATTSRHFPAGTPVNLPLWTDKYNNLFQILKVF
jgi:SAM-dependent methyltransferase